MGIPMHSQYVEEAKKNKYIRRCGVGNRVKLKLIRNFGGNRKRRERLLDRILTQMGFESWEEYINYKIFGEESG